MSILSFSYDAGDPSGTATARIAVTTGSTAPVELTAVYAGSQQRGAPGDNAPLSDQFKLVGKTRYVVTDTVTTLQFCATRYWGVSASLDYTGVSPVYQDMVSPQC